MSDPVSDPASDPLDDLLGRIDACAVQLVDWTEAMGDVVRPMVESMGSMMGAILGTNANDAAEVQPNPTAWSTTVKVFPGITNRPLEPATTGFRLVGAGPAIVIKPKSVSFSPTTLYPGQDTFTVTVQMEQHPNGIYEGTVTAKSDPGVAVTDCVMPAW
jgi:hypothetical protein